MADLVRVPPPRLHAFFLQFLLQNSKSARLRVLCRAAPSSDDHLFSLSPSLFCAKLRYTTSSTRQIAVNAPPSLAQVAQTNPEISMQYHQYNHQPWSFDAVPPPTRGQGNPGTRQVRKPRRNNAPCCEHSLASMWAIEVVSLLASHSAQSARTETRRGQRMPPVPSTRQHQASGLCVFEPARLQGDSASVLPSSAAR